MRTQIQTNMAKNKEGRISLTRILITGPSMIKKSMEGKSHSPEWAHSQHPNPPLTQTEHLEAHKS